MKHKNKHIYIDIIGVAFMIIGVLLCVLNYFNFGTPVFILGLVTMILNEKFNPYDLKDKKE